MNVTTHQIHLNKINLRTKMTKMPLTLIIVVMNEREEQGEQSPLLQV